MSMDVERECSCDETCSCVPGVPCSVCRGTGGRFSVGAPPHLWHKCIPCSGRGRFANEGEKLATYAALVAVLKPYVRAA